MRLESNPVQFLRRGGLVDMIELNSSFGVSTSNLSSVSGITLLLSFYEITVYLEAIALHSILKVCSVEL